MLRTSVAVAALAAVLGASVAAQAADLPRRSEPRAPVAKVPVMALWTGPYVGVNLGYGFGDATGTTIDPAGFVLGAQAGYNYQWDMFVVGLEADINYSFMTDKNAAAARADLDWYGTIRPRVGIAFDRVLPYVTGGFAFGSQELQVAGVKQAKTLTGYTVGAGVEYAFTNNISAKLEYLYMDLGKTNYSTFATKAGNESHIVRAGVNYKF